MPKIPLGIKIIQNSYKFTVMNVITFKNLFKTNCFQVYAAFLNK